MSRSEMRRIQVVDSHTGGEPTRVVVSGGPDLGRGPMAERLAAFRDRHDDFRSAVVNEPRRAGFAYGTLPGHPESGEESFVVEHLADDRVVLCIRAFSRPASWLFRIGYPAVLLMQRV